MLLHKFIMELFIFEQQKCLDIAKLGHNVVICGQAGTGKSYLIKSIYNELTRTGKKVALTATTGIACRQFKETCGAMTVHR